MKLFAIVLALAASVALPSSALVAQEAVPANSREEILRLYKLEADAVVRQDLPWLEAFYPADFVVTNPFNQFIDKSKVIERIKDNIIKYASYDREFDYFQQYGDVMVVVGSETVVPAQDANRGDAGQTVRRRFTEMWVWRDGAWQKVVRHANDVTAQP